MLLLALVVPSRKVSKLLIGKIGCLLATLLTGALELDFSDIESWEEDALLLVGVPLLGPSALRFILVVCREGDDDRDCIPIPK